MYLPSTAVRAFPLGKTRSTNSGDMMSRIFYEQNVSNLIRQIIDTEGFIINEPPINGVITDTPFIFNLGGYYFEILGDSENPISIIPTNDNVIVDNAGNPVPAGNDNFVTIYAGIITSPTTGENNQLPLEIEGQDKIPVSNSTEMIYTGLDFFIPSETQSKTYSYQLPLLYGVVQDDDKSYKYIINGIETYPEPGQWVPIEPYIIQTSFTKFLTKSLNITGIDGKH